MTHDVPRALHSKQTLCVGSAGWRPISRAASVSSSCRRSIGQPASSTSTGMCAAAGVAVASVSM
jgi:hypothetical protein